MGIVLKTPEEIEAMRVAGRLAGEVLRMIREHVQVGITTGELDDICHAYITEVQQAIPAPLNYRGFPKSICTSVNQVVCHGIPGNKKLKNGDILNIDITVIKDGWHGDTSKMFLVGEPTVRARRLCEIAHQAMVTGIEMVKPGCAWVISVTPSRVMQRGRVARWCAITAAMVSAGYSTKTRRYCITAARVWVSCWFRVWSLPSNR